MSELATLLAQDIRTAGLDIAPAVQEKLIEYIQLLEKWNKTHNLTAIREPKMMLTKHILDSLVAAPYVKSNHNLDVGTGAGLPGIPLALASPEQQWTLLDSNSKKLAFVRHACGILNIDNITVVDARVESYQSARCFDSIITRAFSSISETISKTQHLLCQDGTLIAMKGQDPKQELENIPGFVKVHTLTVPRLDEPRHLVCIKGIFLG